MGYNYDLGACGPGKGATVSDVDVVVTGLGATTPLGGDVATTWKELLDGRSGVQSVTDDLLASVGLPVTIAAPMRVSPADVLPAVEARRLDRAQQAAVVAAREAWLDAGAPEVDARRLAVAVGTGVGGLLTLLHEDDVLESSGARRVSPRTVPKLMPNGPAALLSIAYGARAGCYSPASACSSGAEALALGARLIRSGEADVVIAGGTEAAITPITIAGFARAGVLAHRADDPSAASRPFDADRNGFVLGEGAGVVILERAEHARARGARVRATLRGAGIAADAFHITSPHPEGAGQIDAIGKALAQARLAPGDIDHVNAHATGTVVGDLAEALALRTSLGTRAAVTAPKASLGHLVGAGGAVEAILTVLSVETGTIPPTRNLDKLAPDIDLDVVTAQPRQVKVNAAISNSFGFGGQNVTLLFTKS